ncbi:hypothetical protein [Variovorax rhizosphaerae]|uniref:Uncharacterized protein n=1 Tax=Variovorax rhizosphaerae TaxID=1836200 RepID=A0ABU8WC43_9BURK
MKKLATLALVLSTLTACGGGSSGSLPSSSASTIGIGAQSSYSEAATTSGSSANAKDRTRQKTTTGPLVREGEPFVLSTTSQVRFGSGSNWRERTIFAQDLVTCDVATFGDPGVPAPRVCETLAELPEVEPGKTLSHLANEGEFFKLTAATPVRFGRADKWREIVMPAGIAVNCHASIFGDPGIAAPRECVSVVDSGATPSPGTGKTITAPLEREGQIFTVFETRRVRFGSGSNWREATIPAHKVVTCSVATFGDPGAAAPRVCETVTEVPAVEAGKTITHLVNEGQFFNLPVATTVRFGSGNHWREFVMPANLTVSCHVDIFGGPGVPAPRVCVTVVDGTPPAPGTETGKTITAPLETEGRIFSLQVSTRVRFGSGGNWREATIAAHSVVTCGVATFGDPGVPAPRVCETVAQVPAVEPGKTISRLVNEGEFFKLTEATAVRFGSGNYWRQVVMPADTLVKCQVNFFGEPGVPAPRECVTVVDSGTTSPTAGKTITSPFIAEGLPFVLPESSRVRFGRGSNWTERNVPSHRLVTCDLATFGDPGVPAPRVCEKVAEVPAVEWAKILSPLANEGEFFNLTTATAVRFGSGNYWREIVMPANTLVKCHVAIFGDPGVAAPRACITAVADPNAKAPDPSLSDSGGNLPEDVVDASGNIVASDYTRMAAVMSKPAGMKYRYGTNSASYGASGGVQLYGPRPDNLTPDYKPMHANHQNLWQIGIRTVEPGLYSSNQANVTFVADSADNVGIADFQTSNHILGTFAQLPQLSWTRYGGGIDSFNVVDYKFEGIVSGDPIAVARCGGRAGGCISGVAAFQNGVIATVGNNTAINKASVKLPANKVPTGIAMTNGSEFALVTVWDTDALKGQVAVVALAGLCDNCSASDRNANGTHSAWYEWWQEWMGVYPGLPNMGNIAFMKILGYVDLVAPDGSAMKAPTEIAVTTGHDPFDSMIGGIGFMGHSLPLTSQANRQAFLNGEHSHRYAKGGMAVVISKSEKKAAFIDLKPLFTQLNSAYFGGDLGTFNARMASLGQGDNQWPYTFASQSLQRPTVVKMISLPDKPTAVKTTVWGPNQRAWIATQEGTLRVYSLGNYAPGRTAMPTTASSIAELPQFAIAVGRNPTSLAWSKGEPDDLDFANVHNQYADPNKQVIVNSRGDRKVSWVRFGANGSSIVRVLQDPRMQDPIAIEDADNFANWGFVLTVADHDGRAVHNFRYGPVTFSDPGSACQMARGGCPVVATGSTKIEYGGKLALPGKPFQVSGSNVP